MKILSYIDRLPQEWVVKDVLMWPLLIDAVQRFRNTLFIVMLRDFNYLARDILTTFSGEISVREMEKLRVGLLDITANLPISMHAVESYLLAKVPGCELTKVFKSPLTQYYHLLLYLKYFAYAWKEPYAAELAESLGLFASSISVRNVSVRVLYRVLSCVYGIYLKLVDELSSFDNVVVLRYKKYLPIRRYLGYIAKKLCAFL